MWIGFGKWLYEGRPDFPGGCPARKRMEPVWNQEQVEEGSSTSSETSESHGPPMCVAGALTY